MPFLLDFLGMIAQQQAGPQVLTRRAEPSNVTDAPLNVVQYDQVMTTKLVIAYAAGLEILHRTRPDGERAAAVDIACGPGHFTLCLARYLGYDRVVGIDLSPPMVEIANENARKQGFKNRVRFQQGNATALADVANGSCDLATLADGAHHLPNLGSVHSAISELDRVVKPDGLVMVMDLVRLRTEKLTEQYVRTLGHDYVERGLPDFLEDFRNSMYAAWTPGELRQAIPTDSARHWCHIVPFGLPTIQVVLGLPVGRKRAFVRRGVPWDPGECPVPRGMLREWRMLRLSLALSSSRVTPLRSSR